MRKSFAALLSLWLAGPATAQTVNPPVIPPGSTLLPLNNTWTGTNTWINTGFWPTFNTSDIVFVDSYKQVGDTTDCPSFQRAHDAATGAIIRLRPRVYTMDTIGAPCILNITNENNWEGSGWQETFISGTVLSYVNPASYWNLNGTSVRGTRIANLSIKQAMPTIANGWTPTVYAPLFQELNTLGQVTLENIFAAPVYQLVQSVNSGRFYMNNIRGQILYNVSYIDQAHDTIRETNIHNWPYWSSDSRVLLWSQVNMDMLTFGDVDTPFVDQIFGIACNSIIKTVTTSNGDTTKLQGGLVDADGCTYGLNIRGANNTIQIAVLNTQNEAQPQGSGTAVVGGRGIYVLGNNATIHIGSLQTQRNDTYAIETEGINDNVYIGSAYLQYFNQTATGAGAVHIAGTGSTVQFAIPPYLTYCGSCSISDGSSLPVLGAQQNWPANAVNQVRMVASTTGVGPQVTAVGTDVNIPLTLIPKGADSVQVQGYGLQVPPFTVATLPPCNATYANMIAVVSDASAPTYGATFTGGGTVRTLAFCDATFWRAH